MRLCFALVVFLLSIMKAIIEKPWGHSSAGAFPVNSVEFYFVIAPSQRKNSEMGYAIGKGGLTASNICIVDQ